MLEQSQGPGRQERFDSRIRNQEWVGKWSSWAWALPSELSAVRMSGGWEGREKHLSSTRDPGEDAQLRRVGSAPQCARAHVHTHAHREGKRGLTASSSSKIIICWSCGIHEKSRRFCGCPGSTWKWDLSEKQKLEKEIEIREKLDKETVGIKGQVGLWVLSWPPLPTLSSLKAGTAGSARPPGSVGGSAGSGEGKVSSSPVCCSCTGQTAVARGHSGMATSDRPGHDMDAPYWKDICAQVCRPTFQTGPKFKTQTSEGKCPRGFLACAGWGLGEELSL